MSDCTGIQNRSDNASVHPPPSFWLYNTFKLLTFSMDNPQIAIINSGIQNRNSEKERKFKKASLSLIIFTVLFNDQYLFPKA
jgi:hypothetical protein